MTEDELMTIDEVAARLRMTRKGVYDLMRAGRLPYVQIGIQRGRRIRRSVLDRFLSDANRGIDKSGDSGVKSDESRTPMPAAA